MGSQYPGVGGNLVGPSSVPPKTQSRPTTEGSIEVSTPLYLRATMDPGAHLTVVGHINSVAAEPLVDSGATGVFMHPDFAIKCNALIKPKEVPREVRVIDGREISSGLITHDATVRLDISGHQELLVADLTNTGKYPCILGTPWLVQHDPTIRWAEKKVVFDSAYCKQNCLQNEQHQGQVLPCGVPTRMKGCLTDSGKGKPRPTQVKLTAPKHAIVSAAAFRLSMKEAEVYSLMVSEMNEVEIRNDLGQVPSDYQDLQGVFSEQSANELPDHGIADMKIEFKDGQEPKNTGLRPMSPVELEEL